MVNLTVAGSEIAKIGDVCACSTAATGQITKWMARGDSAHRIGVVSDSLYPADDSGSISMEELFYLEILNSENCECMCL